MPDCISVVSALFRFSVIVSLVARAQCQCTTDVSAAGSSVQQPAGCLSGATRLEEELETVKDELRIVTAELRSQRQLIQQHTDSLLSSSSPRQYSTVSQDTVRPTTASTITCSLELLAFGYSDVATRSGYIRSNGIDLLRIPRSPTTSASCDQALGVVILDPSTCNATRNTPTFYSLGSTADAQSFGSFLRRQPQGTVVLGVSSCTICSCQVDVNCSPYEVDGAARNATNVAFAAAGMDVAGAGCKDKVVFARVIGSTEKFLDIRTSEPAGMLITVQVTPGGVVITRND